MEPGGEGYEKRADTCNQIRSECSTYGDQAKVAAKKYIGIFLVSLSDQLSPCFEHSQYIDLSEMVVVGYKTKTA